MLVEDAEVRSLEIEFRQQAHYWRAQHARAIEREAAWKQKAQPLEPVVRRQQAQIAELTGELEAAKARIAWLEKQVFGRKSEQCPKPDPGEPDPTPALDGDPDAADAPEPGGEPRRKRGKQPGAKGYGRKRRHDLPAEDPEGIINADRYSAYKALGLKIRIAFCWAHVRRDFVRVRDGYRRLRGWGDSWVRRINERFHGLPPPEKGNGNGRRRPRLTAASDPAEPIALPAKASAALRLQPVNTPQESALWNELIERYHYLGYQPLPGAQMRYLVLTGSQLLAVLGFGAAAWKVAPRDRFIGWSPEQRAVNLRRIVNNARFLILPWVAARNLASRVLAAAAKRVAEDWPCRYGYEPFLLETFVERNRFRGTCYRAANWVHVGRTQGRGKLDRRHRHPLPVKDIFLYPLRKDFRRKLRTQSGTST